MEVIRAEVDMITEEEGVMEVTTVVDTIIEYVSSLYLNSTYTTISIPILNTECSYHLSFKLMPPLSVFGPLLLQYQVYEVKLTTLNTFYMTYMQLFDSFFTKCLLVLLMNMIIKMVSLPISQ